MSRVTLRVWYVDPRNPRLGVSPDVETDLSVVCDPARIGSALLDRVCAMVRSWPSVPAVCRVELRADRAALPVYAFLCV